MERSHLARFGAHPAVPPSSPSRPRRLVLALGIGAALLHAGIGARGGAATPAPGDGFVAAATRIDASGLGLTTEGPDGHRNYGAGFALRRGGLVATAAHLVERAHRITARLPDGREVAADLVGADPLSDVAVLKISADLPTVTPAPAAELRRGAEVAALGDPLGFGGTLTVGHLSSPARPWGETTPYDFLQHDAALNPGSSGGALIDRTGRVIGMNVAIADGARRNVGIGLAVPIALVERIADRLIRDRALPRPTLGLRLRDTATLRHPIPTLTGPGAVIEAVEPGSPAALAGLTVGQIVVAAEGQPIRGVRDLARALEPKSPGDRFRLAVITGDDVRGIEFTLTPNPPPKSLADPAPGAPLGLELEAGWPTRIRSVQVDSPAALAGLGAGDEILSIGLRRLDARGVDGPDVPTAGPEGVALLVRRGDLTRIVVLGRHGRLDDDAPFGSNAEAAGSHRL